MMLRRAWMVLILTATLSTGCDKISYLDGWWNGGHDGSTGEGGSSAVDIADLLDGSRLQVVEELETSHEGYRSFHLTLTQRMDHDDPASVTFDQHIILHHRDILAPTVLATTGYGNPPLESDYLTEPAQLLQANQLMVEHRYFPPSIPADADWEKLNIMQSAIDFHKIVRLFKHVYYGRWISTGASKGGMTSVFHRRFFPDDVHGTVGYVTPISFGAPDARYVGFLEGINPSGCGDTVKLLQRRLIADRATIAEPLMTQLFPDAGLTQEQAEWASIQAGVSLQWAFWQYYGVDACPAAEYALQDALYAAYFVASFAQIGEAIGPVWAYAYQASTELGYQDISYAHLEDVLADVPLPDEGEQPTPPWGEEPLVYDPSVMQDVSAWIKSDAERLLLIYGELDPWTGGAIDLGRARDSKKLFVPFGTHSADIAQLSEADREIALKKLYRWANVPRPREEPAAPEVAKTSSALRTPGPVNTLDEVRMRSALPVLAQP